jgi:hypothetical protein
MKATRQTQQTLTIELDSQDIELAIASYCRELYFDGIGPGDVHLDYTGQAPKATVTCQVDDSEEDLN